MAGVNPEEHSVRTLELSAFSGIREANREFLDTAIPTIEQFHGDIQGSQTNVILTDAKGIVLYSLGVGTGFSEHPACGVSGIDIREQVDGTTAFGLCLAENMRGYVTGAPHYKSVFDKMMRTEAPH